MGPQAGVSYHAGSGTLWTAALEAVYRINADPASSGYGQAIEYEHSSWYGNFQSEYTTALYPYGAVDNTKWMADGNTLVAAIYEAYMFGRGYNGVPGAGAAVAEQYGPWPARKWYTSFNHVVAVAFCAEGENAATPTQPPLLRDDRTRIFRYNPNDDVRLNPNDPRFCQDIDPDTLQRSNFGPPRSMSCFSGRVTHLEPVFGGHDAWVAVNYQSKAVLVLKNAQINRLEMCG